MIPPYKPLELKAPDHPTRWKAEFMNQFGQNPDMLQANQWTPLEGAFVREELRRYMIQQLLNKK